MGMAAVLSALVLFAGADARLETTPAAVILHCGDESLAVSLACPAVHLAGLAETLGGQLPKSVEGDLLKDNMLKVVYAPMSLSGGGAMEAELNLAWSPQEQVLHKGLRLRVTGTGAPAKLEEVVFEAYDTVPVQEFRPGPPQSYPVFVKGYFLGVEFPIASTRVENGRVVLASKPLCELAPDTWYESRKAVYGPAAAGQEVLAFHRYIEAHRPAPKGLHFNYNSWWTSPVPFTEADILGLMKQFEDNLYKKHGVALDSFTIDMGWSDPMGVWDIDKKLFPEGFTKIQAGAEAMGGHLGLWCSPSSCYPPAVDPKWALDHGYESFEVPGTNVRLLSLAGEKYRQKYGSSIGGIAKEYHLGQIKLDGLNPGGADYMAGRWTSDATAEGACAAFDAMRAGSAEAWLEATYSAYASPWWLFHVNSVIGCFGDDSPHGRVPCPVYRESYTTGRDYHNLQGADRLPSPIPAQEILGVIHQSDEPFMNDAVTTILRGHAFVPLYVNPKYMNEDRWAMLAELIKWSRANADLLTAPNTQPLRPATWLKEGTPWLSYTAPMPREPYGYAHWADDKGLVLLRNPWIAKQSYPVKIDLAVKGPVHAISLYPEPRVYGDVLYAGQTLDVALAPYETVVLSFATGDAPQGLPKAVNVVNTVLADTLTNPNTALSSVIYDEVPQPFGADYTSLAPASGKAVEIDASFRLDVPSARTPGSDAPDGRISHVSLLVLFEGKTVPEATGTLQVEGQDIPLRAIRSDAGFTATGIAAPEHWQFLEGAVPEGTGNVSLHACTQDPDATMSVWLLASRPGLGLSKMDRQPWSWESKPEKGRGLDSLELSNLLPLAPMVWRDSICVLAPTPASGTGKEMHKTAPVEKINGVFLDTIDPVSVKQGFGELKKNRSVWDKEMIIGGQNFRRGLGTHANSEIVYNLDGKYRAFQAWAGPDMATNGSMGFTVFVDGQKRWESGRMVRGDAAKGVEVDLTGAKELRLVVDDGGDSIGGDHADWANARLVK
jgi:hypothetical protein